MKPLPATVSNLDPDRLGAAAAARPPAAAGPMTRFVAWLIDLGICFTLLAGFNLGVRPWLFDDAEAAQEASAVLFFGLPVAYGAVFEACWRGQTPGKRWRGLRVVDAGGGRLRWWQVAVRNALRVVDALPQLSLLGGAACLATARTQRLGDIVARTVVVRDEERREKAAGGSGNTTRGHNPLRGTPGLSAVEGGRIGPEEAALALRALWRREALDPAARTEIFARLAARFRAVAPGLQRAEAAAGGLSDERLVRYVVEILFDPEQDETD